jgi:hypothetical protein
MKTPQAHTQFFRDNGLTIVLMAIFALTLVGMAWTGWRVADEEFVSHGRAALTLGQYLASGEFVSALFENWESEFLQMACYVMLTAALFQRGSAESRDPDGDETEPTLSPKSPWAARQGGWIRALYELSLGLALTLLFLVSFGLHWWGSFRAANDDAISHGEPPLKTALEYGLDARFWFESFQNWQSEFLSTAVIVVLSIMLRQRGSPESKPVNAPHSETGA